MFYKNRRIYGLYVRGISRPGLARDILSIFAEGDINILYLSTSVAALGEEGIIIGFLDLTEHPIQPERILDEIRGISGVRVGS